MREKRDAERECAGKHRRLLLDKIESGRRERMKKKALEDEFKAMKEIYLAKKFGNRWLTAVRVSLLGYGEVDNCELRFKHVFL